MWIVCITSVRHVLTVNGYGGRQTKENEKSWCFKGWETLVIKYPAIESFKYVHEIFKTLRISYRSRVKQRLIFRFSRHISNL